MTQVIHLLLTICFIAANDCILRIIKTPDDRMCHAEVYQISHTMSHYISQQTSCTSGESICLCKNQITHYHVMVASYPGNHK